MDTFSPIQRVEASEDDDVSSLSDYDSEWTQVTDNDSDFPPLSAGGSDRPLSRADDSVDGDVWEGVVDLDDAQSVGPRAADEDELEGATHIAAHHAEEMLSASVATHRSDDEIEHDALNSSVMGTLTASRSRSAMSSLHASLSESQSKLRLSFPDPLTSTSRDNVDTIAAAATAATSDAEPSPTGFSEEPCEVSKSHELASSFETVGTVESLSIAAADTEARIDAVVVDHSPVFHTSWAGNLILNLVLYGSSSAQKWDIACEIMKLALDVDETPLVVNELAVEGRFYQLQTTSCSPAGAIDTHSLVVRVLDRTASSSGERLEVPDPSVPSLAIIFLPASLPFDLPIHSYYLPLINSPSLDLSTHASFSTFSKQILADSAQYAWNHLAIGPDRTINIGERPGVISDASIFKTVPRRKLVRAFKPLFTIRKGTQDGTAHIFTSKWHILLFVVATTLAISVGRFQLHAPANKGVTQPLNSSESSLPSRATSHKETTISPSVALTENTAGGSNSRSGYQSLATFIARSMAQTNFSPLDRSSSAVAKTTPLVLSIEPASTKDSQAEAGPSTPSSQSRTKLWAKKLNLGLYSPTDMIVRPAAVVDVANNKPKSFLPIKKSKAIVEKSVPKLSEEVKAVGLRAVHNSLSLITNAGKALIQVAGKDVLALYDAIDELLQAIRRQIDSTKADSKDPQSSDDSFSRNARAKQNARRLRQMGERIFKSAGERFNIGKAEAVKVAHKIRDGTRAVCKDDATRLKDVGESLFKAAGEKLQAGTAEAVKVAHQLRDGTRAVRDDAAKSREARRKKRQEKVSKSKGEGAWSDSSSAEVKAGAKGDKDIRTSEGKKARRHRKHMLRGQQVGGKDEVRREGDESKGVLEALMDVIH